MQLCPHGDDRALCDKGGCDEFFYPGEVDKAAPRRRPNIPPTVRQLGYLRSLGRSLGIDPGTPTTKSEASDLIKSLVLQQEQRKGKV